MAITLFTLTNNTSSPVGPYGLLGLTIGASSSINVSPPLDGLLSDSALFADLYAGNVSLTIAGQPLGVSSLLQNYLQMLAAGSLSNSYKNIVGNGTTVVKSGPGVFHAIVIGNNNTGGTIAIYDNTSASAPEIMFLQVGSPSGGLLSTSGLCSPQYLNTLDLEFSTGLTVVTAGSTSNNVTIIYQ